MSASPVVYRVTYKKYEAAGATQEILVATDSLSNVLQAVKGYLFPYPDAPPPTIVSVELLGAVVIA